MKAPRRAFLRGLITLPLVGGAVELIGCPRAVAEPATFQLMFEYIDWLKWERYRACHELYGHAHEAYVQYLHRTRIDAASLHTHSFRWHYEGEGSPAPSERAALILASAGCDWRGGYAVDGGTLHSVNH